MFGAQSSTKRSPESRQLSVDFFSKTIEDEACLHVIDIARYLQQSLRGCKQVPLNEIWDMLDNHPIFPSEGFRKEIKSELINVFNAKIEQIVNPDTGKKETVISFSS